MTEDQFNNAVNNGQVSAVEQPPQAPSQQPAQNDSINLLDYEAILQVLRMPKAPFTTVPTFQPKTFVDSIQWIDDGTTKRPIFFINGVWVDLAVLVPALTPIFDPFGQFLDIVHWGTTIVDSAFNEITSGTGSVIAQDGNLSISTSSSLSSYHGIASKDAYYGLCQSGKPVTVEWIINNIVSTAQNDDELRLYFTTSAGFPSDTGKHFGFKLIADGNSPTGIKIFGCTADGVTENATLGSTYQLLSGVQFTRLKVVYTPGTDCKFYLNGTLIATNNVNLPGTADLVLNMTLKTNTGLAKEMRFGRVLIQKIY